MSPSKKNFSIFLAVVFALAIALLAGFYGVNKKAGDRILTSNLRETENNPALPDRDTYFISSKELGPKVYEATFDPLGKIFFGAEQRVRVKVNYEMPVDSVNVKMIMDSGAHLFPLTLKAGSPADGIWEGSWKVADTHRVVYQAEIEAKSGGKVSRVVLSFQ